VLTADRASVTHVTAMATVRADNTTAAVKSDRTCAVERLGRIALLRSSSIIAPILVVPLVDCNC
jgi:hypothetical protein